MDQLISLQNKLLAEVPVQTVNARDLHAFLQVRRDFSTWIRARIEKYGFVEGVDFISHSPNLGSGENQGVTQFTPGILRTDYHLTLDMAKELSMVENNDQGRQARRYFIEAEKRLWQGVQRQRSDITMLPIPFGKAVKLMSEFKRASKVMGITNPDQQVDFAVRAMEEHYHIDFEAIMKIDTPRPGDHRYRSPAVIGKMVSKLLGTQRAFSSRHINDLLFKHGYQTKGPTNVRPWFPSFWGEGYSLFENTGKRFSYGRPIQELRWSPEIAECLADILYREAKGEVSARSHRGTIHFPRA